MAGTWGNPDEKWSSIDFGRLKEDLEKPRKGILGFLKGLGR